MSGSTLDPARKTELIAQRRDSVQRHWEIPMPFLLWPAIDARHSRHAGAMSAVVSCRLPKGVPGRGLVLAKINAVDCLLRKTRTI